MYSKYVSLDGYINAVLFDIWHIHSVNHNPVQCICNTVLEISEVNWFTLNFLGTKGTCTLGWPYIEGTWLYFHYFIWCVSCTVVVLTCFVICVCVCGFCNVCACVCLCACVCVCLCVGGLICVFVCRFVVCVCVWGFAFGSRGKNDIKM
jgi:hypothetical protein